MLMVVITSCPGESERLDGFLDALVKLGISDLESAG
jgi:hypothetical protein